MYFRYSAPLYVDITKSIIKDGTDVQETQHQKTFLGKIPIMLRSTYCLLNGLTDRDLTGQRDSTFSEVTFKIASLRPLFLSLSGILQTSRLSGLSRVFYLVTVVVFL